MLKKFDQILKDIEKKQFEPVYFLCGDETYFIDTVCDALEENILSPAERDFNQTVTYGKEVSPSGIVEMAMRYPMMAKYNVVIVKEAQEIKKIDELTKYVELTNATSVLVICYKYKNLDKRTSFYKTLEKHACLMVAEKVKEHLLPAWINNYLNSRNITISSKATMLLVEYMGSDLAIIINQLNKLIQIQKDIKTIEPQDIEKHIGISREYSVFELQKALAARNYKKLARIYNFMKLNPKANPIQLVVNMLFTFFSKLYVLDNTPKKPFTETYRQIEKLPWLEEEYKKALTNYKGKTEKVLQLLQEFDLRSKGVNDAGTDERELMKELLFRLIQL